MKILLDHNIPRQIKGLLSGHDASTARDNGWEELVNGQLLAKAEAAGFECLLTGDQNLGYQNNLEQRRIAVLVVNVTKRRYLSQHIGAVIATLDEVRPGQYVEVILERPSLRRREFKVPEK